MPENQINQDEIITCNNLAELYCLVSDFLNDYYTENPYTTENQATCSALVKETFPQMRDMRIHKAVTAIMVNAGLRPDSPEYTHFCPKCFVEWIHEAEAAFTE